jgi:leucyl-tRNA synthetase
MYNIEEIEKKWKKYWDANKTFKVENDFSKPKYYTLDMFPFPSWAGLHVGHPEWMTANDIVARYKNAKGFNVLHPMGWDAFWLPAENYAIKTWTHPKITTKQNIDNFRKQIKSLGFSYDWDREVDTTDPEYYKWTQWIFLKMFEKGLAYEQNLPINYCPSCKTGLANEEVLNDFSCERCGEKVVKKKIRQWVLAITKYADRLLTDIDKLDWPEGLKDMQRNWIGKSEGCEFNLKKSGDDTKYIGVYTTRIDTVFGMTYAVLAPDHKDVQNFITEENKEICEKYIDYSSKKSDQDRTQDDKEKTWVFTGSYVINPFNGKEVQLWIWDYVLWNYWTWAVMAVPAHDERDFSFAKKYNLEIIESISWWNILEKPFTGLGILVNSWEFTELPSKEAQLKMRDFAEENNFWTKKINYKLRDWLFSRQRYWGDPIPLVHCKECGIVWEKEENLPVLLPETDNFEPSGDGTSPLSKIESFINCECPKCWGKAKRETNTMPQWGGSCWYYLRYMNPDNKDMLVDPEVEKYWGQVDSYVGGAEHAVLHLLYARFWHKFLFDIGVVSNDEPFYRLRNQGLITAHSYENSKWKLIANDLVEEKNWKFFEIESWEELKQVIAKMSKSLKNVVNPDEIVEKYWADTLRLYEMYMADFKDSAPWDTKNIIWVKRFLDKVERAFNSVEAKFAEDDNESIKILNKTIKKVEEDIENYKFNTAIASMMILVNYGRPTDENLFSEWKDKFVVILWTFAPFIAEELYSDMWNNSSVFFAKWPEVNESLLIENTVKIAVQVLGKVRSTIEINKDESKDSVLEKAKTNKDIIKWLEWKNLVKEIYVPGKIVNLVVK